MPEKNQSKKLNSEKEKFGGVKNKYCLEDLQKTVGIPNTFKMKNYPGYELYTRFITDRTGLISKELKKQILSYSTQELRENLKNIKTQIINEGHQVIRNSTPDNEINKKIDEALSNLSHEEAERLLYSL